MKYVFNIIFKTIATIIGIISFAAGFIMAKSSIESTFDGKSVHATNDIYSTVGLIIMVSGLLNIYYVWFKNSTPSNQSLIGRM